jgi:hypothetical protein
MRKILCITLLILAAALSVAPKPRAQKRRAQKPLVQKPLAQKPLVQEPLTQEPVVQQPLVQSPIAQEPVVQQPRVQQPLAEKPLAQEPLVQESFAQTPLVQWPLMQWPLVQNPRSQNPLGPDTSDPFLSDGQPSMNIMPALEESPGTQFSPDLEGYNDLTGLATYADAQIHSHTHLVTVDVVYSYRSYVMPGNPGDAFLGNVINVQGPNGGLRVWMPFSANAGYWVGFIFNMEGYVRYHNLRMTYDADCGIVTALEFR